MERSLVLVKPDAMQRGLAGTIIGRLEGSGLRLVALKMLHVSRPLAERHYAIHRDKPFYNDLVDYIISTPIVAAVFDAQEPWSTSGRSWGPPTRPRPRLVRYAGILAWTFSATQPMPPTRLRTPKRR